MYIGGFYVIIMRDNGKMYIKANKIMVKLLEFNMLGTRSGYGFFSSFNHEGESFFITLFQH